MLVELGVGRGRPLGVGTWLVVGWIGWERGDGYEGLEGESLWVEGVGAHGELDGLEEIEARFTAKGLACGL